MLPHTRDPSLTRSCLCWPVASGGSVAALQRHREVGRPGLKLARTESSHWLFAPHDSRQKLCPSDKSHTHTHTGEARAAQKTHIHWIPTISKNGKANKRLCEKWSPDLCDWGFGMRTRSCRPCVRSSLMPCLNKGRFQLKLLMLACMVVLFICRFFSFAQKCGALLNTSSNTLV